MTQKNKLLRAIQMYSFALDEIKIYLDTHPECKDGLDYYHKYKELRSKAVSEYRQRFGPLTADEIESREKWTWVSDPWPWERSANNVEI